MWVIIAACVLTWGGEKLAIPGTEAQKQAESVFSDVYGQKIKAAKTTDDKSALARELLNVAKTESDAANKFVILQTARKLAVEAQDETLALEIVKACVEAFATPEDGQTEVLLERAEKIWELGQSWRGESQLAARLDAVEQYWRSGNTSALIGKKWEERIEQVRIGGKIILKAEDAKLVGKSINYEASLGGIASWFMTTDYPEWAVRLPEGKYEATVTYGIKDYAGRSVFALVIVRQGATKPTAYLQFQPKTTGKTWEARNELTIGKIAVPVTGHYRIMVLLLEKGSPDRGTPVIVLKSLSLRPL